MWGARSRKYDIRYPLDLDYGWVRVCKVLNFGIEFAAFVMTCVMLRKMFVRCFSKSQLGGEGKLFLKCFY